jgi:hypothetical protein
MTVALTAMLFSNATAQGQVAAPAGQNAALRYWMAFAQMQELPAGAAERSAEIATALANVEAGSATWNEALLGPVLDANYQALDTLMRASRLPSCDWGFEFELGPTAPVAYLAKARALARLNTLAGIRLAARGSRNDAVARWLAGMRVARHVAEGGTLVSTLTGWSIFRSALQAAERTAGTLDAGQRRLLADAIRATPDTVFDWSAAMRNEQRVLEAWVTLLARDPNPQQRYTWTTGKPPAAPFIVPGNSENAAFRRFMDRAVTALGQPPEAAGSALAALEKEKAALPAFYQGLVPSLTRVNQTRAEVKTERDRVLAALK